MSYLRNVGGRVTPQSEPMRGDQVENSAGGFTWKIDKWARFRRFLILGSEGGSYYTSEQKLTAENATAVRECIAEDGQRAVDEIVDVSTRGLAPKADPAIFALAIAASAEDRATRLAALNAAVDSVCRIGTHIQHFVAYCEQFRGWGRALRATVARWYREHGDAYQLIKYKQRDGWSNRDLLRLAHPKPSTDEEDALWGWVTHPEPSRLGGLSNQIIAAESLGELGDAASVARAITEHHLPREVVPSEFLTKPEVWEALFEDMPMTAMIRNLSNMTRVGLLAPMSAISVAVAERLRDAERLHKARVHPLALLIAMRTYASGHGLRGHGEWEPVATVTEALEDAFYLSFETVEPTGKRTLLGLDVSGSMGMGSIAGTGITPAEGTAAMAMVTARVEQQYHIMGFSAKFIALGITARDRLDDALKKVLRSDFGGTDCALPMQWAEENKIDVDTFVIYTDDETWAGDIHPAQALVRYRERVGINARLAVVGMLANSFTIADPNDPGMMDFVGFDASTPQVMSAFSRGEI